MAQRTVWLQDVDDTKNICCINMVVSNENGVILNQYISDKEGKIDIKENGTVVIYAFGNGYDADKDTFKQGEKQKIYLLKKLSISINPFVVTGEYGKSKQSNSVNNIRVIDAKKAIKQGAQNLGELLQNEVNISLQQDNVLGSNIIMQGVSGQNIKILIDGVPMIGRLNGSIDISQINLNNVKSIEVIEGPMSVIYGTDALGGVINVITKKHKNKLFSGGFAVYTDQLSNINFDLNYQKKLNKNWNMYTNYNRQFFGGVDLDKSTRSIDWKPKLKNFGNIAFNYHKKKWNHRIDTKLFMETLKERSDVIDKIFLLEGINSAYSTLRLNQAIFSDIKFSSKQKLKFINSVNYYQRTKNMDVRNLSTGTENKYGETEKDIFMLYMLRGIFTNKHSKKIAYQVGYDANINNGKGNKLTSATTLQQTDIALFSSLRIIPHNKVTIQPAARFIYNSKFGKGIANNGFLSKVKLAPIIPSLHIKYSITDDFVARFSYGKGFRAPTLKEMHLNFVDINHNVKGNKNLQAENSHNLNGSFNFIKKINKTWWLGIKNSLFYNDVKDKINLALLNEALQEYTYINIGEFQSQGVGFDIMGSYKSFRTELGISIINTNDKLEYNNTISAQSMITNQARFNINYRHKKSNITTSIFLKRSGRSYGYNEKQQSFQIEPYTLMDLTISKNILKYRMNFTMGCKNLLDITSIQNVDINSTNPHGGGSNNMSISPGRSCFFSLNYTFGKNEPNNDNR